MTNLTKEEKRFYKKYNCNKDILYYNWALNELKLHEQSLYKEQIEAYNNIIESLSNLLKSLNVTNLLDIFTNLSYILWNGYISEGKKFYYQYKDRKNIESCLGLDIINCKGVCLNNASLLNDILRELNYESYLITNKVLKKIIIDYIPDIIRKKSTTKEPTEKILRTLLDPLTNLIGNHACVLVKKDNVYYIFDITKLCIYKLDKFLKATPINGTGEISIKPYSLKVYNNLENYEIIDIVESYQNQDSNPYTPNLIKESFIKNIELCKHNITTLDEFYIENKENRSKILKLYK